MSNNASHQAVLMATMQAIRDASADSLLTRRIFAERAHMHSTDAECVDFLRQRGPLNAGQIAHLSHLTKGAVTTMLNRLKRRGIVTTRTDPQDNRKLVVEVVPASLETITADYVALAGAIKELLEHYSAAELQTVLHFNTALGTIYRDASIRSHKK